ncbi:MAG TPA: chemotaxis protein CheW [Syntrophorhabdaceae bacterium]|jgi:purine-binding chemotaxis protein CheW
MSVPGIIETRQYLTFNLGDESFALDVANVREILEFTSVTKVPQTPEFMRGVINLRGSVVPVMDMRVKFNLAVGEKTVHTCIIVVEVTIGEETTVLGALVDSVQEVFELEPGQIEPAPKIGTGLKTDFIKGMGKRDDRFIIILDIDRLFSEEELLMTDAIGEKTAEERSEAVNQ